MNGTSECLNVVVVRKAVGNSTNGQTDRGISGHALGCVGAIWISRWCIEGSSGMQASGAYARAAAILEHHAIGDGMSETLICMRESWKTRINI